MVRRAIVTRLSAGTGALLLVLLVVAKAQAGTYAVSDCSYYGNSASVYQPDSTAAHLSPANECLVRSGNSYRSLEINEVVGSVLRGYGAGWSITTPSPAIMIDHVYTPVNAVLVDCSLRPDGFAAGYY